MSRPWANVCGLDEWADDLGAFPLQHLDFLCVLLKDSKPPAITLNHRYAKEFFESRHSQSMETQGIQHPEYFRAGYGDGLQPPDLIMDQG